MVDLDEPTIIALLKRGSKPPPVFFDGGYKQAAVLIPFIHTENGWELLFTRRADGLQEHNGQVSFPGGAVDSNDNSLMDTAIREACEEIGLCNEHIRILGCLPEHISITRYRIYPFVGIVKKRFIPKLSVAEVNRLFSIPLEWLADETHREERLYRNKDGIVSPVIIFDPYDGEVLWGITARITLDLLSVLGL